MPTSRVQRSRTGIWSLAALALIAGALGIAAVWTAVAVGFRTQAGWMALIAAIDAAVLLRIAGVPEGRGRAAAALLGTVVAIALANWFIAATGLGQAVGLRPLPSALRLGPEHAWILAKTANSFWDWLWAGLSLPLAWWASRGLRDL